MDEQREGAKKPHASRGGKIWMANMVVGVTSRVAGDGAGVGSGRSGGRNNAKVGLPVAMSLDSTFHGEPEPTLDPLFIE